MGFVKVREELAPAPSQSFDAYDAQTLFVVWETSQQTVKRLLPPPLRQAKRPLALAFISTHPRTSVGPIYREAALALMADLDGLEGFYYLSMPVTDNMAMVYGRELLGYPKKLANIAFYRDGQHASGSVERHGVRYFATHAQLAGTANVPDARAELDEIIGTVGGSSTMVTYSFKYFVAPNWDGFDFPSRLVREEVEYRHRTIEHGFATVVLTPSEFDPWSEVEVIRTLGAAYTRGVSSMRRGQLVTEVQPTPYMRHAQLRVDLR